jgi:hypothetical protein
MYNITSIIQNILQMLTPFVLVYLTYKQKSKEKNDNEYRTLRENNENLLSRIIEEKQMKRDNNVEELQNEVKIVKKEMELLKNDVRNISEEVSIKVKDMLKELVLLNNTNLEYCQSLSSVITTLAGGIGNNNNNEISDAIKKHQQLERDLFSRIIKTQY